MNTANTFEAWTDRLAERPEIYPHQLNLINDSLLLVKLSSDEIRAASFLDQRVLGKTVEGQWVNWQGVADRIKKAPAKTLPGFIFHVGHCGSTLVSRLMEFAEDTQCFREPLPLRTLAQDLADLEEGRSFLSRQEQQHRLKLLSGLWRRGAQHTVIKATSICTDLLQNIHSLEPTARALFIYNRAETHITTLLAGQNALMDLKGFAQLRLQRLQKASGLDIQLHQLSMGQLAALSWLSETTSINRSIDAHPQQISLLEFESLLQNPAENLGISLTHLGIDASPATIEKAVASPVLSTYSKAPEHEYNAQTRAAILNDSRSRFGQEIRAGMAWIEHLAGQSELVATTLKKFA
jgi:hypothetical protein